MGLYFPIFTRSSESTLHAGVDFYSSWSPSLLRTSTECDTTCAGVFSGHVKHRIGDVDTTGFTLNTILFSWTSRTAFNTSPAAPGYVDVRIPVVLYQDDAVCDTIYEEVLRRAALSTKDKL